MAAATRSRTSTSTTKAKTKIQSSSRKNTTSPSTKHSRNLKPALKKPPNLPAGHRLYQGTATIGAASSKSPTWEKIRHGKRVGFFVPETAFDHVSAPGIPFPGEGKAPETSIDKKAGQYLETLSPLIDTMAVEPAKALYWAFCHLRKAQEALLEVRWQPEKFEM